ncbi:hypothetical protein EYF80_065416 [Liparis tanakae]|uniref:Uncharacterized protein n=1 Tax=Liparis tanakae TaxID=230148 RepID=A0A4Z2E6N4_9TELE|nr:hypothetical protein EYF80_065416 [Liparis tanakae]
MSEEGGTQEQMRVFLCGLMTHAGPGRRSRRVYSSTRRRAPVSPWMGRPGGVSCTSGGGRPCLSSHASNDLRDLHAEMFRAPGEVPRGRDGVAVHLGPTEQRPPVGGGYTVRRRRRRRNVR